MTISVYLDTLVRELTRLPGIGQKSASRAAFHLLSSDDADAQRLAKAILDVKKHIKTCTVCGGISEFEICPICSDDRRDHSVICIVEHKKDILTIEKTGAFKGLYHVLGGVISPLDGIGPEQLAMTSLFERCAQKNIREIIIATNPTIEGDATSLYISQMVKRYSIRVMRLSRGLPVGGDIEYADIATIARSLSDRHEV